MQTKRCSVTHLVAAVLIGARSGPLIGGRTVMIYDWRTERLINAPRPPAS